MVDQGEVRFTAEHARGMSRELGSGSDQVQQMIGDVSKQLGGVLWLGEAARSFKEMWDDQFKTELTASIGQMRHYAQQLTVYTDDQEAIKDKPMK